MVALVVTAILAGSAALFWALYCDEMTARQRAALRAYFNENYRGDQWWELAHAFDDVDYTDHFMALLSFRDPANLYPEAVRAALRP